MIDRRGVLKASMVGPSMIAAGAVSSAADTVEGPGPKLSLPCVISTWDFGVAANQPGRCCPRVDGRLTRSRPGRGSPARILKRKPDTAKDLQVGFLAINKRGEVGAWAIQKGFTYALCDSRKQDRLLPGESFY